MKKSVLFVLFFLFVNSAIVNAQELSDTLDKEPDGLIFGRYTPGLIFTTSDILLSLGDYQSGVGIKLKADDYAIRASVNVDYESSDNIFELGLGGTYERPFFTGRVSPYWGGALILGYEFDGEDDLSSNETTSYTAGITALLGAEIYVFDFLSFFAEYGMGFAFSRSSSDGDTSFNYRIGTDISDLGNQASIGVTVYLFKQAISNGEIEEDND
jgi:hypothetical protein